MYTRDLYDRQYTRDYIIYFIDWERNLVEEIFSGTGERQSLFLLPNEIMENAFGNG